MTAYQWAAWSTDLNALPVTLGISDDHERARAAAAEAVLDGRAFFAVIETVRPVIGIWGLARSYVAEIRVTSPSIRSCRRAVIIIAAVILCAAVIWLAVRMGGMPSGI
jgi:hypothetical protein